MAVGTIAKKVPQTIEQADKVVSRIRRRNVRISALDVRAKKLDGELKKAKADKNKLEEQNQADQALVRDFADAHRDELTSSGKTKSFKFPSGAVGQWALPGKGKLVWKEADFKKLVLKLMKLTNYLKYLKIEFRKDAIKADLEELAEQGIRGFSEDKQERFWVKT